MLHTPMLHNLSGVPGIASKSQWFCNTLRIQNYDTWDLFIVQHIYFNIMKPAPTPTFLNIYIFCGGATKGGLISF
jgi:hypothetical protein